MYLSRMQPYTPDFFIYGIQANYCILWCKGTINTLDTIFWTRRVGSKQDTLGILRENSHKQSFCLQCVIEHPLINCGAYSLKPDMGKLPQVLFLSQLGSDYRITGCVGISNTRSSGYKLSLALIALPSPSYQLKQEPSWRSSELDSSKGL